MIKLITNKTLLRIIIYTGVIQRKNAIKITCYVDLKLARINIKYKNEGRREKSNIKKAI